jgi:putative heme-binding domain-containing protein
LASRDAKAAAAPAAELLSGFRVNSTSPSLDPLLAAFLKKEGGTQALAAALRDKGVNRDVALLSLRYVQSTGQDAGALSEVLTKSAGITGGPKQLSPDQMKQFVADVAKGDPARGEAVFRTASAQCFQCHALAGAGGTLAPDLRSIGAASPVEYIIESLLDPNKAIKDGYSSLIVTTKDGDLVHGIKVREDRGELVLRDNVREEIAIPVPSIKSRKDGGSLMPAGLTDMMTRAELVDLVRFLTELGKPGPYALPNEPVVRRWRVMGSLPGELAEAEPKVPPISSGAGEFRWFPAYTMASGVLPANAVRSTEEGPVGFARCEIEATEAGKVQLALNSPKGLTVWVGERRVPVDASGATLDLPGGVHVLTLRVDLAARGNEGIRLDVADAPDSPGHAQPVGGR